MVVLQNQQLTRGGSSSTMTTGQATNPATIALSAIRSFGSEGNGAPCSENVDDDEQKEYRCRPAIRTVWAEPTEHRPVR
jgi:hypothetical protein